MTNTIRDRDRERFHNEIIESLKGRATPKQLEAVKIHLDKKIKTKDNNNPNDSSVHAYNQNTIVLYCAQVILYIILLLFIIFISMLM